MQVPASNATSTTGRETEDCDARCEIEIARCWSYDYYVQTLWHDPPSRSSGGTIPVSVVGFGSGSFTTKAL